LKISYISLGCPKNQVDLEHLIHGLNEKGFETVTDVEECDALIVNTCGFIEPAVTEAIETILEMSERLKEGAKLIATGCMTERYKDTIADELPEIDFLTGVGTLDEVIGYLEKQSLDSKGDYMNNTGRILVNAPYFAYLKISEGCSNRCAYCTIPSIRGPHRSRPKEDIIAEVKSLAESGVKEIILISQDNTKYGQDIYEDYKISDLLDDLSNIDKDFLIRIMYLNPDGIDEKLVKTVAENEKIIKYFDIPLQHISDRILKSMNRKSDNAKINEVYDLIREKIPSAFIRNTFIIGFPGETEEDFNELLEFIQVRKPDFAGFFGYQPEEGTPAAKMEEQVGKREVRSRISKLQKEQRKNTLSRLKNLKKSEIICFAEKSNEDFEFILEGRAIFQAPEIDGQAYFIDGVAENGYGPYRCRIKRIKYPDIYCEIINNE